MLHLSNEVTIGSYDPLLGCSVGLVSSKSLTYKLLSVSCALRRWCLQLKKGNTTTINNIMGDATEIGSHIQPLYGKQKNDEMTCPISLRQSIRCHRRFLQPSSCRSSLAFLSFLEQPSRPRVDALRRCHAPANRATWCGP